VQLEAGDTLVMGSDGLFDNMFDRDIEAVVSLFNDTPEAAGTTGEVSILFGVTMSDSLLTKSKKRIIIDERILRCRTRPTSEQDRAQ
jgi:serine/threonine protein phosphatase PrpC